MRDINHQELIRYFLFENTSLRETSSKYGISVYSVSKILKKYGIERKKTCTKCGKLRRISSFPKNKNKRLNRDAECLECKRKRERKKRYDTKLKQTPQYNDNGDRYCSKCKDYFNKDHFYIYGRFTICRNDQKKHVTRYIKNNKEKHSTYVKNWIKKKEEELGKTYGSHLVDQMADCYIAALLKQRKYSNIHPHRENYNEFGDLFEKQREKLKMEREIKKEVR